MSTKPEATPEGAASQSSSTGEQPQATPSWMTESEGTVQSSVTAEPQVPERNYDRDPRLLQWIPPAAPLPPNRTLQTFFRVLANLLFWGGGATALVALFYKVRCATSLSDAQRVVLPRLAILNQRLASLHTQHLSLFGQFTLGLRTLVTDNKPIYSRSVALLDERAKTSEGEPVVKDEAVQAAPVPDEAAQEAPVQAEMMFEPVLTSLRSLRTELDSFQPLPPSVSNPVPAYTLSDPARPSSSLVKDGLISSPTRDLLTSLEDLSTYISTTQFYLSQSFISAQSSRTVGAAAGTSVSVGGATQPDIAMQCRSEIRGLKGLLLNRRSFAFAPPAAS